ncbi:MAG: F0F1 ATP synthase subunit delta [Chloroflexi bacterium]|nr:F0F1 ATP synthase subunit delta [Chloroflexota bacterium]
MANESMARAYAQAIFEKAVASWLMPLKTIYAAIAKENLTAQLDDNKLAFAKKETLLSRVIPAQTASEVKNLIALLASKNEIHLLPEVIAEFDRYAQRAPEQTTARVISAVELRAAEKKSLEAKMQKQFGASLAYEYSLDPSLLGGVVVRVGDKVIDASVAGKLAALREKLQ